MKKFKFRTFLLGLIVVCIILLWWIYRYFEKQIIQAEKLDSGISFLLVYFLSTAFLT